MIYGEEWIEYKEVFSEKSDSIYWHFYMCTHNYRKRFFTIRIANHVLPPKYRPWGQSIISLDAHKILTLGDLDVDKLTRLLQANITQFNHKGFKIQ